jgi:branched-chain amino acid transport system ATP-binding protein
VSALLQTVGLTAAYGQFKALFGVDFEISKGECVAVIGANGAGKTTLMRSISGVLPNQPAMILHNGDQVGHLPAEKIMQRGIAMVPEGRKLFPSLSVEENLLIGGQVRSGSGHWNLDAIYALFPILKEKRLNPGTALSGGQQQMVAIGRALMSNPENCCYAPVVIRDIYAALPQIRASGASVILVEQDITRALGAADRVYCMMEGRITLTGRSADMTREAIHDAYFGGHA